MDRIYSRECGPCSVDSSFEAINLNNPSRGNMTLGVLPDLGLQIQVECLDPTVKRCALVATCEWLEDETGRLQLRLRLVLVIFCRLLQACAGGWRVEQGGHKCITLLCRERDQFKIRNGTHRSIACAVDDEFTQRLARQHGGALQQVFCSSVTRASKCAVLLLVAGSSVVSMVSSIQSGEMQRKMTIPKIDRNIAVQGNRCYHFSRGASDRGNWKIDTDPVFDQGGVRSAMVIQWDKGNGPCAS